MMQKINDDTATFDVDRGLFPGKKVPRMSLVKEFW